jgi:hypothetical protein
VHTLHSLTYFTALAKLTEMCRSCILKGLSATYELPSCDPVVTCLLRAELNIGAHPGAPASLIALVLDFRRNFDVRSTFAIRWHPPQPTRASQDTHHAAHNHHTKTYPNGSNCVVRLLVSGSYHATCKGPQRVPAGHVRPSPRRHLIGFVFTALVNKWPRTSERRCVSSACVGARSLLIRAHSRSSDHTCPSVTHSKIQSADWLA